MNPIITNVVCDEAVATEVLNLAVDADATTRSYWKMVSCRTLGEQYTGAAERMYRMDATKTWTWKDDKLSQMVRNLVSPFVHFYEYLTRVELLIQKPNEAVYCHRDRITGQVYDDVVAIKPYDRDWLRYGPTCQADPLLHQKQHYLGGRLALGPPGRSYTFEYEGFEKSFYDTGDHFFFLNENVHHGADAVDFWRGVVFFDGIHDPEQMEEYYDSA